METTFTTHNKVIMKLTEEQQKEHDKWGFEFNESGEFSQVRTNMMEDKNYTPYCIPCPGLQRFGPFNGSQMICPRCKAETKFPSDFIERYKAKHNL